MPTPATKVEAKKFATSVKINIEEVVAYIRDSPRSEAAGIRDQCLEVLDRIGAKPTPDAHRDSGLQSGTYNRASLNRWLKAATKDDAKAVQVLHATAALVAGKAKSDHSLK